VPVDRAAALSTAPGRAREPGSIRPALVLAPALCYLSVGCWSVVLPGWVLGRLHGSSTEVGWVMGLAPVLALLLRSAAGGLGDRLGRRGPALAGAALLTAAAVVLLLPPSLPALVLSRLLDGAGDALFATAVMAWAVEGVAPERHGRTLATVGMGIWLGTALAPQWATLARDHGGYRAVWVGAALVAALAGVAVARIPTPPEPLRPRATREPAGPADAASALARIPRGALVPTLVMFCACYGDGVFSGFGIVHLRARGIPAGAAASVFTIIAVTTLLGRFAGGTLADRWSPRRLAAVALVLLAAGYGAMALAASFALAAVAGVLMGSGLAFAYPALGVLVSTQVPPERRGAGFGVFLAALDAAFGLGPALGGLIVSASSTSTALWSGSLVALLSLPLLGLTLPRGPQLGSRPLRRERLSGSHGRSRRPPT
jgi:MFS family permease